MICLICRKGTNTFVPTIYLINEVGNCRYDLLECFKSPVQLDVLQLESELGYGLLEAYLSFFSPVRAH